MNIEQLTFRAVSGRIDKEAGILNGVSVISVGPVKGHGIYVDDKTLATVKECAEKFEDGLRVKMEHHTGASQLVGVLGNFRIAHKNLRADLKMLKNSRHYGLLLEMAETMPSSFGLSISFSGDHEEVEPLPDLKVQAMRCREIYSCDVVDSPAANPSGLFSMKKTVETPPVGDQESAGNNTAGVSAPTETVSLAAHNELATLLENVRSSVTELSTNLGLLVGRIDSIEQAGFVTQVILEEFATKLRAELVNADLVAMKKLGALGVPLDMIPAEGAPSASSNGKTLSLSEQLGKITDPLKRHRFLNEHKKQILIEAERR